MNISEAIQLINSAASKAHSRYIVSGFGQIMVYQEKADEAADYIAANYPAKLYGYPLIESESSGTGKTPREVADNIITKRSAWVTKAAKIEKVRFTGKTLIMEPDANILVIVEEIVKALNEM